ncbi:fimbrillin family protein [Parasphaerochaeta coccoides]|uniref:Listeria/Bacterioides repeat-containing protein n=1 Tax=Parasphaerochaeta coccoides (strain ATCC BAA-1237 / DSM 17374 / SPN1) TaxID=760011 RepID=F4GHM0_PARC1|nr:fimbrillin family protein [Parasphaerochaeta coccoides]AEC02609.1 Listeria/Bacterioides repeat-containing protein [Parasphaerochaeta coccoides DSM 17374]
MRKNSIVFVSIFMVFFVFVACSGEVEVPHASNVRFTTEIGRKVMADSAWQAGDEVGIYMVEAGEDVATVAATDRDNVQYVADTAGINFSAFSPVDASNPLKWDDNSNPAITHFDFIAYYPYVSPIADTTALPIHVYPLGSGEQDTGKADFLWGRTDTVQNNTPTVRLKLEHMLSRLIVNLGPSTTIDKDAINGGTLVATVTGLNTKTSINLNDGTLGTPGDVVPIVMKDISGTLTDAERSAGNRRFETVLIPVDNATALAALQLEFALTDGSTDTYTWAATSVATSDQGKIHFDAGKQHVYNMTLNTSDNEVAVAAIQIEIKDQDTGSLVNGAAEKAYSLTFGANGATRGSAPGRMYAHKGSQVTLPTPGTLEKNLHYFYGWNTETDGSGDSYAVGDSFVIPGQDVTLYAIWVENQYSVSFDGNGATGGNTPGRIYAHKGSKVTLSAPGTLEKDIHYFYGWNTLPNGNGTQYAVGESFTMPANDVTLYARWLVKIKAVSAGKSHTMILKMDGTLWATGDNYYGQLGDKTMPTRTTPVRVSLDVAAVSAGESHTMILKKNGTLWATGRNNYGQLGDATRISRYIPVQVKVSTSLTDFMTDVVAVSTGERHTMILKKDGTLWATGDNEFGQVGDKTMTTKTTPVRMGLDVAAVSAGATHTMILKKDGTLWATGRNYSGQLGDDTRTDRRMPVLVMSIGSDVAAVSAGATHTMILKKDGTLWATGDNSYGQLGIGNNEDKNTPVKVMTDVKAVSAGVSHTMILKKDGTLWATGNNEYGQLGLGDSGSRTHRCTPKQVTSMGSDVAEVSAGAELTMILKKDGTLWATGRNRFGQRGDGDTSEKTTPVQIIF